jgi:hypothetical protein
MRRARRFVDVYPPTVPPSSGPASWRAALLALERVAWHYRQWGAVAFEVVARGRGGGAFGGGLVEVDRFAVLSSIGRAPYGESARDVYDVIVYPDDHGAPYVIAAYQRRSVGRDYRAAAAAFVAVYGGALGGREGVTVSAFAWEWFEPARRQVDRVRY